MRIKTYKDLILLPTFEERYEYLKLGGIVGRATFGFDRRLNQGFYQSREWKQVRHRVIIRDNGCDLGIKDREIYGSVIVHHLNAITIEDVENGRDCLLDINNLICTTDTTHNAIHFADESLLIRLPVERSRGDTSLWTKVY